MPNPSDRSLSARVLLRCRNAWRNRIAALSHARRMRFFLRPEMAAGDAPHYREACIWLSAALSRRTGGCVFGGPFAGMRIPLSGSYFHMPNLWVGCYEAELHRPILNCLGANFGQIVNIGSAEGYYAVGLARLFPSAKVVAFDSQPDCWQVCRQAAELNGVAGRIDQRGLCSIGELAATLEPGALVICDCEGAELTLMNPSAIRALASATLMIELHDFANDQITPLLAARFRSTHHIEVVMQTRRIPADYMILDDLTAREKWLAVHENRYVGSTQLLGRYMILTPADLTATHPRLAGN